MEEIYSKEYMIGPADIDRYQRLRPSQMLLFIQQVAGLHSEALSLTYEELAQRGIFWAVIRHRVQITRMPKENETIRLETWPMPTTRAAYPRSTVAYDAQGKELFRSMCLWVLMDLNNRSMLLPKDSGITINGTVRGMELASPRSLMPKPMDKVHSRRVVFSDLDRNGHMNNARYLDWIQDLMPSDFHRDHPIQEMTMCYVNEAREQQDLDLTWDITPDGELQIDIHRNKEDSSADYDRIFAAKVRYGNGIL